MDVLFRLLLPSPLKKIVRSYTNSEEGTEGSGDARKPEKVLVV